MAPLCQLLHFPGHGDLSPISHPWRPLERSALIFQLSLSCPLALAWAQTLVVALQPLLYSWAFREVQIWRWTTYTAISLALACTVHFISSICQDVCIDRWWKYARAVASSCKHQIDVHGIYGLLLEESKLVPGPEIFRCTAIAVHCTLQQVWICPMWRNGRASNDC